MDEAQNDLQRTRACRHVYEEVGADYCPDCGAWTHKVNWELAHQLHREWIASGKAVPQGWWSI